MESLTKITRKERLQSTMVEEFIHSATLNFDYAISENFNVTLFGSYSQRQSSGGQLQDAGIIDYDFYSTDAGISLGLNTTF